MSTNIFVRLEKHSRKGYNIRINRNGAESMALTAYCKKCAREVYVGEVCPFCGTRLGKNAAHAAWCVERTPVKDWLYWNSVMRLLLPGALAILVLVLLLEGIAGGISAVERMMASAFLLVLGILMLTVLVVTAMILLLQGKELSDFVVDNRGIHETRYLPDPTPLKLILRMKAPRFTGEDPGTLKLGERQIAWKDIARVQLWPEKCMVLFYAPSWWLRIPVVCTPFTWGDTMDYIREKLGRKKNVRLPKSLASQAPAAARRRAQAAPPPPAPDIPPADTEETGAPAEPLPEEAGTDPLT